MTAKKQNSLSSSAQGAKDKLKEFQKLIQPEIETYFDEQIEKVDEYFTPHSKFTVEVLRDYTERGGKRLRGSFVYYVYQMYGGDKLKEAMKMAIVIEIVHAYALLHDDFMDISPTRRHGPSGHVMFQHYFEKNGLQGMDPEHWGNCMAVMTGSIGFHMAMQLLNSLSFSPETRVMLSDYLNRNAEVTYHGQIADVINPILQKVGEEDIINTLRWKTGVYTYQNPIHNGAIMAGIVKKEDLDALTEYAIPAGIAFQIQDDILGLYGEEDNTGKSATSDLEEGKYTLLVHKVFEKGSKEQVARLKEALGNEDISKELHNDVKQIVEETGSLKYSRELAHKFVKEAQDTLKRNRKPSWQEDGYNYLKGIADYMIERDV